MPKDGNLDGRFAPTTNRQYARGDEFPQGEAILVHTKRHTIISFWDRTGDCRNSSNSSFVVVGHFTFKEIIQEAKKQFPRLFYRFNFEIKLIDC